MPLSVSNVGSNWRILFSKKSLIIAGSRSGSSPISLENHLKQASLSEGKTASSARHCQICFAWSAHNHSWPSYKIKRCHEGERSTWLPETLYSYSCVFRHQVQNTKQSCKTGKQMAQGIFIPYFFPRMTIYIDPPPTTPHYSRQHY